MENHISIIIPMYNSEEHISDCLDSVIKQRSIVGEIWCVDDGSEDNTVAVCKEYQQRYDYIYLIQQEHKGVSAARNAGLKRCKGSYVAFVDSDDWIEPTMFSTIVMQMEKYESDIGISKFNIVSENNDTKCASNNYVVPECFGGDNYLFYAFHREDYRGITAWVWNKVFRKSFLDDKRLLFDESVYMAEDVLFMINAALEADKFCYVDIPLYNHRTLQDSLSRKYNPVTFESRIKGYEKAISCLEKSNVENKILDAVKTFHCYHALNYLEKAIGVGDMGVIIIAHAYVTKYKSEYSEYNYKIKKRLERLDDLLKIAESMCARNGLKCR